MIKIRTEEHRRNISKALKGKPAWNKGITGYKLVHKKIKELDFDKIKGLIDDELSTPELSRVLGISIPTVRKYVQKEIPEYYQKLLKNGKIKQSLANYKDGQASLYRQLLRECRRNEHPCEECGTLRNIEIHHKEKLHYDKQYRNWKADNFNNNKENIIFLCNSCHQKLHYRELGKECKVKKDPETGRFLKKDE